MNRRPDWKSSSTTARRDPRAGRWAGRSRGRAGRAGPGVYTHGGAAGGRLWVDPANGFAFAFLTNLWAGPDEPVFRVLEEVYRAVEATR